MYICKSDQASLSKDCIRPYKRPKIATMDVMNAYKCTRMIEKFKRYVFTKEKLKTSVQLTDTWRRLYSGFEALMIGYRFHMHECTSLSGQEKVREIGEHHGQI
jgi:hypothetical protein